jgi:mycoredoxin
MLFDEIINQSSASVLSPDQVIVYGTKWCGMTQVVRRFLERQGIPYRYIDLELYPGAKSKLQWLTGGHTSHPTVYINGHVLIEPSLDELRWALSEAGYY